LRHPAGNKWAWRKRFRFTTIVCVPLSAVCDGVSAYRKRYVLERARIVKIRIGGTKMAGNQQVCAHQKWYKKLIFQNNFEAVVHFRECSCAPVLRLSLHHQIASNAERQIQNNMFSSALQEFQDG